MTGQSAAPHEPQLGSHLELAGRRIALVLATSTGGVGAHVRSLITPLVASGADVHVLGPAATETLFGFTGAGARFTAVEIATGPDPVKDGRAALRLRRATSHADLVHAHGLRAGLVAVTAGLRRHVPTVVTLHNALLEPPGPRRRVLDAIEDRICRRADLVLGVSPDLVARAMQAGARDARMAPAAAPPLPAPARPAAAVREELGAVGRPLILAVARLHEQKGFDVLLPAAARWAELDPMPLVVVAGEGPLEQSLRTQIAELGAPVRLLGRRSDVADLLGAADLVVLPSRWEGWPLAAQEAIRAGVPLVAAAVGGLPELVGQGGVLVRPGDVDALDAAVRRLLRDPEARQAVTAAAGRRAETLPTEQDTVDQIASVYVELLGPP